MAQHNGLTKSQASFYERGRGLPSTRTLAALLHALGADVVHLQKALHIVSRSPHLRDPRK